ALHRAPFAPAQRHRDSFSEVDAVGNTEEKKPSGIQRGHDLSEKFFGRMMPVFHAVKAGDHIKTASHVGHARRNDVKGDHLDAVLSMQGKDAIALSPVDLVLKIVNQDDPFETRRPTSDREETDAAAQIAEGQFPGG